MTIYVWFLLWMRKESYLRLCTNKFSKFFFLFLLSITQNRIKDNHEHEWDDILQSHRCLQKHNESIKEPLSHKIISLPLWRRVRTRMSVFAIHSDDSLNDIINIFALFLFLRIFFTCLWDVEDVRGKKKNPLTSLCSFSSWEFTKPSVESSTLYKFHSNLLLLANFQFHAE